MPTFDNPLDPAPHFERDERGLDVLRFGESKVRIGLAHGFNLLSMKLAGQEIVSGDHEAYQADGMTGCPTLVGFPNRVGAGGHYTWQGKSHHIPKGEGTQAYDWYGDENGPAGHFLHGLPFESRGAEILPSGLGVIHTAVAEFTPESPGFAAYPFPCTVTIRTVLTGDSLGKSIEIRNNGASTMPIAVADHGHFEAGDEAWLQMEPTHTYGKDRFGLPTKRRRMRTTFSRQPTGSVGRLRSAGLDDYYDFDGRDMTAQLSSPLWEGRTLHITSQGFPHAVVYTPGEGRQICVEPATSLPDAIHHADQSTSNLLRIEPDASWSGSIAYALRETSPSV